MAASKTLIWAFLCLTVYGYVVVEGQESSTVSASDADRPTTGEPAYSDCNGYCLNGGRCEVSESLLPGTYEKICKCNDDYVGRRCQYENPAIYRQSVTTTTTQAYPCDSNPCQHGGECYDNYAGYFCNCPADWQGDNCEKSKPCFGNPCLNDGKCEENGDDFTCSCPNGWKGERCEVAPPRVLSRGWLKQVAVDAGQKVTRDCHAKGHPLPCVAWVKDGSEDILNVEEVEGEDEHEDHKILRLTIDEMRAEDEGLYRCVATNVAGSHDRKVTISIAEEDEE